MSSQVSVVGYRDYAVYCASKGGVNQLTKALALEWSSRGVTVNAVGPTFIYTPGTPHLLDKPEVQKSILDRLPIARLGTITDVAGAVIYLASPAGGLVTGELLLVDGGWTAQYLRRHSEGPKHEALESLREYVGKRVGMTDYPSFRQAGYDCGSGPTESFCGTLTLRLKGRGMYWDKDNAEAIMALGSLYYSNLWTNYWAKQRAA